MTPATKAVAADAGERGKVPGTGWRAVRLAVVAGLSGRFAVMIPGFQKLWFAAVALPLAAFVVAGQWSWNGVLRGQTDQVERTVAILHEQALRTFETQDTVLTAVEIFLAGRSWEELPSDLELRRFVHGLDAASRSVDSLGVIAPDGRIVVASDVLGAPPPVSLADRDFVRAYPSGAAALGTFVASPVISRVTGKVEVHLSRPHVGPDGRADGGVIASSFSPDLFQRLYRDVAGRTRTEITLARRDGVVLARYPDVVRGQAETLSPNAPALAAHGADELRATHVSRTGSLLAGLHLVGTRWVDPYPVAIQYALDPALVRDAWLREMALPTAGAGVAMAVLLLLTARAQMRTREERARLLTRTQSAEAGQAQALDRAELEARLRQTEKVAALGQLAAGVAHDFNNVLQAVLSGSQALRGPGVSAAEVARTASMMADASARGIELTRRMLDYARRDDRPARLGDDVPCARSEPGLALRNATDLLGRTLSGLFTLRLVLPPEKLPATRGGQAELETVVINLVVNARDAMPGGGTITVSAARFSDEPDTPLAGRAGVRVDVADTGIGMSAATLARAGEAFFTTKRRGEGTGLGLSMARGYAERTGGMLTIESREGNGTRVSLWLPLA